MPHLTLETLARLVDEAPTIEERRHLRACEVCREELDALKEQTAALGSMPKMAPPPDLWPGLRTRLRKEGIVAGGFRRGRSSALTRIAAALALFLAGGVTGYVAAGPQAGAPAVAAVPTTGSEDPPSPDTPAEQPPGSSDATEDMERAQELFTAALDRYMRENSMEAPDPAARLAALDNIVMTTAEALNESPADPVINSYHLTAVAQRNELLRQIAATGEPVF